jgi:subtilisin family serine protease
MVNQIGTLLQRYLLTLLVAGLAITAAGAAETADLSRLSPKLRAIYRQAKESSHQIQSGGLVLTSVRVQIDTGPGGPPASELRPKCLGRIPSLKWQGSVGSFAQVALAPEDLAALAEMDELFQVILPPSGMAQVTTEGVAEHGADKWHELGELGAGTKVGVIDVGFALADSAIARGELPQNTQMRSFWHNTDGLGDITGDNNRHGTACAEIIHDLAPEAQLYLANAGSLIEFDAAIRWMLDEGVGVINHSVGWFWGPGDGTGAIVDVCHNATNRGIMWVNSAGNYGERYWQGVFLDQNSNGRHEFDGAFDESITYANPPPGTQMRWILTWDRWPYSTDLSFELDLYRGDDATPIASSENLNPDAYAYRELVYVSSVGNRPLELRLRRKTGTDGATLRIFQIDNINVPEHGDPSGSIIIPADSPQVLSVGAYWLDSGQPVLQGFSSRGPTPGGLIKPEILAVDEVSTWSWSPFRGTSAACPHITGLVALLQSSLPAGGFYDYAWTADELATILDRYGLKDSLGDVNSSAWGLARLPDDREVTLNIKPPLFSLSSPAPLPLHIGLSRSELGGINRLRIFDTSGRLVHQQSLNISKGGETLEVTWDGRDRSGRLLPSGCYYLCGDGPGERYTRSVVVIR